MTTTNFFCPNTKLKYFEPAAKDLFSYIFFFEKMKKKILYSLLTWLSIKLVCLVWLFEESNKTTTKIYQSVCTREFTKRSHFVLHGRHLLQPDICIELSENFSKKNLLVVKKKSVHCIVLYNTNGNCTDLIRSSSGHKFHLIQFHRARRKKNDWTKSYSNFQLDNFKWKKTKSIWIFISSIFTFSDLFSELDVCVFGNMNISRSNWMMQNWSIYVK